MAKRGQSGLSLMVGVRKEQGMSSHDAVNKVRGIFGERRVGHAGTLDPLAEGVLPVCIGPATRLDKYLVDHDKAYRATITFGTETNTDDSEGQVTETAPVPEQLAQEQFALGVMAALIGQHQQVPPAYSAIKINGKPAYKRARAGEDVALQPRTIRIMDADLVAIQYNAEGQLQWVVDLAVSKGTYIRSIAHDLGRQLNTRAHMSGLLRTRMGAISLDECVPLDALADLKQQAALDPVRVLPFRFAFADSLAAQVANGTALHADELSLYEPLAQLVRPLCACCTSSLVTSTTPAADGELISLVTSNRLQAVYRFDATKGIYIPDCVFSVGVARG